MCKSPNRDILFVTFYDEDCLAVKILAAIAEERSLRPHILYLKRFGYEQPFQGNLRARGFSALRNGVRSYANTSPVSGQEWELVRGLLQEVQPATVFISTRSFGIEIAKQFSELCRRDQYCPIIAGGWGPTLQPEPFLEFCDHVCFGEGERPFEEMADLLIRGETGFAQVGNLITRKNGKLVKNSILPPLTAEEYSEYLIMASRNSAPAYMIDGNELVRPYSPGGGVRNVYLSKGCPLNCTYCMSGTYREMYRAVGHRCDKYRLVEVEAAIAQLEKVKRQGASGIFFVDSIFPFNEHWLDAFLPEYSRRIGLPFYGYLRPEFHSERTVKRLTRYGLKYVHFGIQTGSERMRKDVFRRNTSIEKEIQFAFLLRRFGIPYEMHFIVNCSLENEKDLSDTLDMICRMPRANIRVYNFTAFPGSPISEQLEEAPSKRSDASIASCYAILFCLAARGPLGRTLAQALSESGKFRRSPGWLYEVFRYAHHSRNLVKRIAHPFLKG